MSKPFSKEDVQSIIKETLEQVLKDKLGAIENKQKAYAEAFTDLTRSAVVGAQEARKQGKGINLAKYIKALAATKGRVFEAHRLALNVWGEDDPVTKALASDDFAAGGAVVPPDFNEEIIELLRPMSVVRRLDPIIMDMPNGSLTMPKITGGVIAAYVGENVDIPEAQPIFGDLKLVFKKLVALVPISSDLLRFGSSRSETVLRDDIIAGLAAREDIAFIRDDGTQDTPKGLRYWPPAANLIPANGTVNLTNVTVDLSKLVLALEEANVKMLRPAWLFAPRTKQFLMTIRDGNGNFAYREEMLRGVLWGFPFAVTTQIPKNLGGGNDESEIYFVDMADAIIGEGMSMKIDASTEASYVSGGSLVSSYSRDQTVIRAITEHDFGMRHDASVAILTAVKWI